MLRIQQKHLELQEDVFLLAAFKSERFLAVLRKGLNIMKTFRKFFEKVHRILYGISCFKLLWNLFNCAVLRNMAVEEVLWHM